MKHFDLGSILIIITTFVLFVSALFFIGLTHDILLEAGVFLVSAKLIIMAYKARIHSIKIELELQEIKTLIKQNNENTYKVANDRHDTPPCITGRRSYTPAGCLHKAS